MKFTPQQNGVLRFKVFQPMSNKEVKFSIEQEIMLQSMILSHEQRKCLKTYLNSLVNDDLFVDGGEIELRFGFTN